jgi:hypothetical protein
MTMPGSTALFVKGKAMAGKQGYWRMALVLLVGLLLPSAARAGPFLGDWGWFWHPAPDCPRGAYSPLHYWAPTAYRVRACVHPSNLDQYPPGPCPPILPSFEFTTYRCRTAPPIPTAPYADPTGYYGRPVAPP